jgi:hypothetical protein
MINLVFTLVSAVLGMAMFGLVLFSNASAEASAGDATGAGADREAVRASDRPRLPMAIDEVRAPRAANSGMSRVAHRALSATQNMQMAAEIPGGMRSFRQM